MGAVRRAILFFLAAAVLGIAGCSTRAQLTSGAQQSGIPRKLLLLPPVAAGEVSRERAEQIRALVRAQLAGKNFLILEDELVDEACPQPDCPGLSALASRFQTEGVVSLSIDSVRRSNFVAGYYNAVGATLFLRDVSGREILSVKHRASERGGLLFNAGQVVEGIRSSLANVETDSFPLLAARLAEGLVGAIPDAAGQARLEGAVPSFQEVRRRMLGPDLYEVCIQAADGLLADMLIGDIRANLRPNGQGAYCGNFLLPPESRAGKKLLVELRTPYGVAVQRPLELESSYAALE